MRIVFVNLHCNEFLVKTASKYVFKQAVAMKHRYLLDYLMEQPDIEVCSYVNMNGTSLASSLPSFLMKILRFFRFWESRWILKKNGLKGKVRILKSIEEILPTDILVQYQLYVHKAPELAGVKAYKVLSLLHFFGTEKNSEAIKSIKPDLIICESDLRKNCDIFKKYYSWCTQDILVHPFVAAERFKKMKPFDERVTKVFSTGTITYKTHSEFLDVYGDPCDQPIRKFVKLNQESLNNVIDCYNSDFAENANSKMEIKSSDGRLKRLIKSAYYKFFASQQKSYFSFNMVEKFNDYKMCLIGEEILGIPGIGFVEGMSCGCAYIGVRGYYEDYGMQEGVNYIGYDGSPEDLINKIEYYQNPDNAELLESIAVNGYLFAQENFKGNIVAERLMTSIFQNYKRHLGNE